MTSKAVYELLLRSYEQFKFSEISEQKHEALLSIKSFDFSCYVIWFTCF